MATNAQAGNDRCCRRGTGPHQSQQQVGNAALTRSRRSAALLPTTDLIADERGYQGGWASHKFREKFKEWPPTRYADPLPPDDEVRSWVRSRAIAYARAQTKQAAQ